MITYLEKDEAVDEEKDVLVALLKLLFLIYLLEPFLLELSEYLLLEISLEASSFLSGVNDKSDVDPAIDSYNSSF